MNTSDRVRKILVSILKIDNGAQADIQRDTVATWDSLKHIELIFALEEEFDIQFDEEILSTLSSLTRIVIAVDRAHAA